jgi:hypothetical protein
MGGTYNDVYGKSDLCSGCHQYANENSVIVDDTYDSWLRSSFGKNGVRCQDCHMKPARDSIIVSDIGLIDAVRRDPERLTNHLFRKRRPGDLSQTATLDVSQRIVVDTLVLTVTVTNRLAGHNLPTGVSLRNILLVLNVRAGNQELRQVFGLILPGFAGTGSPVEGNYSGQPGKAFALITQGATGDWPVPNWLATGIHSDTRIPSGGADSEEFGFRIVSGDPITVSAELIYRAVYKPWADAKGWNMRQSMMADTTFVVQTVGLTSTDPVVGSLELFQNYPNPFNPVTTVSFRLSVASEVRLSVYDVLGREVEVLVNERKSPGRHDVAFDASGLASGVYLYRLQAGTFAQTRKMAITR